MPYVEEREFTLRFQLQCAFPEDYDGELDGYAWMEGFPTIAAEVLRAAVAAVQKQPGWKVRPVNRGIGADREITLLVERDPG